MSDNADENKTPSRGRFTLWVVIFALVSLIAISAASLFVFYSMGHIELSWHGWLALIAGGLGSVILGGGLMALSFYSARSGHDQDAHYDPDKDPLGGPFSNRSDR